MHVGVAGNMWGMHMAGTLGNGRGMRAGVMVGYACGKWWDSYMGPGVHRRVIHTGILGRWWGARGGHAWL